MSVEKYIAKHPDWKTELETLCKVLRESPLEETVKWGAPCYVHNNQNVVGVAAFKQHIALWFHQGALLDDKDNVLINAQEGKTRAMRQWRFQSGEKIPITKVRRYVKAAANLAKSGQKIKPEKKASKQPTGFLKQRLDADKILNTAFKKLTPGKQREYIEYVEEAKRDATRENRVEKITPMIKAGTGLNDKYRS